MFLEKSLTRILQGKTLFHSSQLNRKLSTSSIRQTHIIFGANTDVGKTVISAGLIRASGHELFRGCVVFPEFDSKGHICSAIGFRIASRLREWDKPTVKWVKPPPDAFELMGLQAARDMINGKTYQ